MVHNLNKMDEDFVMYGTPLKSLDEDNVHKAKAPRIEDQIVTDDKGRRRFHGAFTGGFSAGYFNSVGSKEGFIPSTFVSSRTKKENNKFTSFTAQDFMDDEDLADHGIAPQAIRATSSYDQNQTSNKRKREIEPNGPIPGQPVLQQLLKPASDTMGIKILKKLGWRPGQGIGPRISRKEKKSAFNEKKKFYVAKKGIHMANDSSESSDEDCAVGFAPDDVDSHLLSEPKSDVFGIGYKPLERRDVFGFLGSGASSRLDYREKSKKVNITGHAFGVGAYEEEDEDIYSRDDMSKYDFNLQSEEESQAKKVADKFAMKGLCDLLDGFDLSSKQYQRPKIFPVPVLPPNFTPKHSVKKRRFDSTTHSVRGLGRHDLSADDRKRILSTSTTVEVREGVKSQPIRSGQTSDPPSTSSSGAPLKPFEKDRVKQKRYENYLKFRDRGMISSFHAIQPKSQTEWEKESERREFENAAALYAPQTTAITSRFTSATFHEVSPVLKDGINDLSIHKLNTEKVAFTIEDITDEPTKAARAKMFGQLTRKKINWHPHSTLCKRFNVPNPFPESHSVGIVGSKKEKVSIFNFLSSTPSIDFQRSKTEEDSRDGSESSDSEIEILPNENEDKKQEDFGLKVSTEDPPSMDLFKAIFEDSDSEGEEDLEKLKCELQKSETKLEGTSKFESTVRKRPSRFESLSDSGNKPLENSRELSPLKKVIFNPTSRRKEAKGIFKNIDFEAINEYRNVSSEPATEELLSKVEKVIETSDSESVASDEEYGPALPPPSSDFVSQHKPSFTLQFAESILNEKKHKSSKHKVKKSKKKKSKKEKKHKKESNKYR